MFVIADFWFTLNSTSGSEKIIEEKDSSIWIGHYHPNIKICFLDINF